MAKQFFLSLDGVIVNAVHPRGRWPLLKPEEFSLSDDGRHRLAQQRALELLANDPRLLRRELEPEEETALIAHRARCERFKELGTHKVEPQPSVGKRMQAVWEAR